MAAEVPEEAIEAAAQVVRLYKRSRATSERIAREAVEAAAPLIVAAWLEARAQRMDDATGRIANEDRWDRGWHAAWATSAEALRSEASVLRGEGDQ